MAYGLDIAALFLKYLLGKQSSLIIPFLRVPGTVDNSPCDVESLEQSMVGDNCILYPTEVLFGGCQKGYSCIGEVCG